MATNDLISMAIFTVLVIFSAVITDKLFKTKKKKIIFFMVILLISASIMSPVSVFLNNAFMDFKSPESVFNFTHTEEIVDIIYGENSCMVIYKDENNAFGQYIIPISNKKYKMPNTFEVNRVSNKLDKSCNLDVYKVSGTDDYYIIGFIFLKEEQQTIVNNENKKVKNIVVESSTETKTIVIYDFIDNIDEYYLLIDDNIVSIKE